MTTVDLDRLVDALTRGEGRAVLTRALTDVTTDDVGVVPLELPDPGDAAWPLVAGLAALAPLVERFDSEADLPREPTSDPNPLTAPVIIATPTALLAAAAQSAEKAEVASEAIDVEALTFSGMTTTALGVDLALQAAPLEPAVRRLLDVSVAAAVEAAFVAVLGTAPTAATDLETAVAGIASAGWAPPYVIVAPVGTADLAASGYPLIVTPFADATYVVATSGVAGFVVGPDQLDAVRPSTLGRDIASYAMHKLSAGTGAVAKLS